MSMLLSRCKPRQRAKIGFAILCLLLSANVVRADGMVFPEQYSMVEIPEQQALIHFSEGIERLVIETSFLAEGTNFAWVVPLPAPPEIRPVSETFFPNLQQMFRPNLVHHVTPYFVGLLLVLGIGYLGERSLRDETSWLADLPLCCLLAIIAGVAGRHIAFGIAGLALALATRCVSRTPSVYALTLLGGILFAAVITFRPEMPYHRLVDTMSALDAARLEPGGVTILATRRAGVFETSTIQADTPTALVEWLKRNGYHTHPSAELAISQYVKRGWVFVASRVSLSENDTGPAVIHPLAFVFPSQVPVYPTALTATANRDCSVALYVFDTSRASARGFKALRCDRVVRQSRPKYHTASGLHLLGPEVQALVGDSNVGTKLVSRLSAAQMSSDVEIGSTWFRACGRRVYSHFGAAAVALNVALPLAGITWMLIGLCRGGWQVDDRWVARWRWRACIGAATLGFSVFLLLPKVEVQRLRSFQEMATMVAAASRH